MHLKVSVTRSSMTPSSLCGQGDKMWVLCYSIMYACALLILLSLTPELLPSTPSSPTPLPKETWDGGTLFINDWHTTEPNTHFSDIASTHGVRPSEWCCGKRLNSSYVTSFSASSNPGSLGQRDRSHYLSLTFKPGYTAHTRSFQAAHILFRPRPVSAERKVN